MACSLDIRFYCTPRTRKAADKSKHRVHRQCGTLKKVLGHNPEYGVVIPGHAPLRKMRVAVPDASLGKRGGYRLIYRYCVVDQTGYVILLSTFFKGDFEDLTKDQYSELLAESNQVMSDPLSIDWEDSER